MPYQQITETFTHERGATRVTIAPHFGGRIAQIEIHDGASWLPLLCEPPDTAPERRSPMSWGSFPMVPWPNRVANSRFMFDGNEHRLPANDGPHALHGLGFDRPWKCEQIDDHSYDLHLPLDDLRESLSVRQRIEVLDDGLTQSIEMRSAAPYPAGAGWHPWFRRDVRPGADVLVLVDADERYELTPDRIPTGRILPVDGGYDLRAYPPVGNRGLDDCYRNVRSPMRIAWGDIELTMTSSGTVTHAVVYTPDQAVCIEPQTCAIDAFNLNARGIEAETFVVTRDRPLIARTEWRWKIGSTRS
jgi:galactose mutarotase-like enzyme